MAILALVTAVRTSPKPAVLVVINGFEEVLANLPFTIKVRNARVKSLQYQ